ncbi:MAG: sigma-70 family RNA polymerase sigma factor [Gemmataceae bacterium]|nr:sigma-70 family RNA polymerase sigma factor [Gemmataceae bacterium]
MELDAGSSLDGAGEALATDTPSPSRLAMQHEQAQAMQQALDRLPEDYRQVLVLRYQEQRSFEEIARLMERSPNAVRKLWLRALRRLQQEQDLAGPP